MNSIQIETGTYILTAVEEDDGLVITGYEGSGSRLTVPDSVTRIAPKAFFANKGLREVYLPAGITSVGDWAFAGCENLRQFVLLSKEPGKALGRGVFDNCHRIENICLGYEENDDLSTLMAAVIEKIPAEYLLKDEDIGNSNWFSKWDQCVATFLNEPDIDGYTDLVLCGEEDIFYNEPDFAMNKRKKKCSLCMLRLLYPSHISDSNRKKFTDYILSHNKGCETEEAWEEILNAHGEDTAYFRLLSDIGGITDNIIDSMLADMGEYHAEAKAYVLSLKKQDFWDSMLL